MSRNAKNKATASANVKSKEGAAASPKSSFNGKKQFELNAQRIAVNKVNINITNGMKKKELKSLQYLKYM